MTYNDALWLAIAKFDQQDTTGMTQTQQNELMVEIYKEIEQQVDER